MMTHWRTGHSACAPSWTSSCTRWPPRRWTPGWLGGELLWMQYCRSASSKCPPTSCGSHQRLRGQYSCQFKEDTQKSVAKAYFLAWACSPVALGLLQMRPRNRPWWSRCRPRCGTGSLHPLRSGCLWRS